MKNCIVAQSGGPTAAINASLAGVIKGVLSQKEYGRIYGTLNGITGILEGRSLDLTELFQNSENLDLLKVSPGVQHFLLPKNFLKPYFRLIILSNFPYFYVVCAVCI